jgi:hypothetical protein
MMSHLNMENKNKYMTISSTYLAPTLFERLIRELIKSTWLYPPGRSIIMPATLDNCINHEAIKMRIAENEVKIILSALNSNFLQNRCFLDRLTNLWRYEFDIAHILQNTGKNLSGDHIWPPVKTLLEVLHCAYNLLSKADFNKYARKLSNHKSRAIKFS